jgi:hypothetical protein
MEVTDARSPDVRPVHVLKMESVTIMAEEYGVLIALIGLIPEAAIVNMMAIVLLVSNAFSQKIHVLP